MKIAVLCGGPSRERGVSLNSARSVLDHLSDENITILPVYFDLKKNAFLLSPEQLYSNTPSDFDFKLQEKAKPLSKKALIQFLKTCDLTFPALHGPFGEDGEIQKFLEEHNIPFIGSGSEACSKAFDKYRCNKQIANEGFFTLPTELLRIYRDDHEEIIRSFFKKHQCTRAIVKPASGGSSVGVFSVNSPEEAIEAVQTLFSKRMDTRVVLQPFCPGTEFTVMILQNRFGQPVAIVPTETEQDYSKNQIFDYRRKYLPTNQVRYHCPPRYDHETISRIRVQAEQIFALFGLRDVARFDGFLLPNGEIWFSDFNPMSGMEQNSFLFQQASRVGMSHRDILRFIVKSACRRSHVPFPQEEKEEEQDTRKPVFVLFGGSTSERQVSLMSGTNVWLKLRKSNRFSPTPFLLEKDGETVWKLPYVFTLNHTVEEITESCRHAEADEERIRFFERDALLRLALQPEEATEPFSLPEPFSLQKFLETAPFAFLALHGGMGEDGTLQKKLKENGILHNGSKEKASQLCMDKYATAKALKNLEKEGIFSMRQYSQSTSELLSFPLEGLVSIWKTIVTHTQSKSVIVKPQSDGCSSGVLRLSSAENLIRYVDLLRAKASTIPPHTFPHQGTEIEMPNEIPKNLLFEPFIETDSLRISGHILKRKEKTGWIEVTTGVLEKDGVYHALSPSITVAEGAVLSVEEKFQGGTGVNITPPPKEIVPKDALQKAKICFEKVAQILGIQGYVRIDAFLECATGNIIIIEANSLPALTPSTVLFHQGLAEIPPLFPISVVETIIKNSGYEI